MAGKSDRIAELFKKNGGCYLTADEIATRSNLQKSDVLKFIEDHPDRFKNKKNKKKEDTFLYKKN